MKAHPAAAVFPMLDGEDYAELLADIRDHGQREPVRTWDGLLLDGRNRKRACDELGIDCAEDPFHGTEQDAIDLVVSLNLHRRHLSAGQRATIAVELLPMYEAAAKERQGARTDLTQTSEQCSPRDRNDTSAAAQAAKATGANRQYVADAKKLKEEAPEDFDAVKQGKVSLPKATAKLRKAKAPKPLVEEKKPEPPPLSSMDRGLIAPFLAGLRARPEPNRRAIVAHLLSLPEFA